MKKEMKLEDIIRIYVPLIVVSVVAYGVTFLHNWSPLTQELCKTVAGAAFAIGATISTFEFISWHLKKEPKVN